MVELEARLSNQLVIEFSQLSLQLQKIGGINKKIPLLLIHCLYIVG